MCKDEVGELINKNRVFLPFGLTLIVDLHLGHRPSGGHTTSRSLLEFAPGSTNGDQICILLRPILACKETK
jgi:hypothetical protein